jgi:hypothetical protein
MNQAVDFVLSKINLAVGTLEKSNQAPVAYEMPQEVAREAIVNAVAHRDYIFHQIHRTHVYLTDGFVTIIRRRPELALKAVTSPVTPPVTPQVGTK